MTRRRQRWTRREAGTENRDRWLFSYADFITLMFTFFAALYAMSTVDKGKVEQLSGSLREAFRVIEKPIAVKDTAKDTFTEEIREIIATNEGITVRKDPRGTVITFSEKTLFPSGSAEVRQEADAVLQRVSKVLGTVRSHIIIEGHTDDRPITGARYASNWELSTARAASVLHVFISHGLDPNRFSLAGYGEFRPVGKNDSDEGRARNRRVEVVITNR
ncbi:MAG TPA: OmpA family protein [Dissulfurispiraceae bacterium]|nr:OmpA family protein [Dissulfurispiraceae bacterium]